MRMSMDSPLKRAIDANFGDDWITYSLENALKEIKTIVSCSTNPSIFRKQFDATSQKNGESVREFVTRLKALALDCQYVCPFDAEHI